MTRRQSFFAHAALFLGVITFASSFARPTTGQQKVADPSPVGRYQISAGGPYTVYVIDTMTAKVWRSGDAGEKWYLANSPIPK